MMGRLEIYTFFAYVVMPWKSRTLFIREAPKNLNQIRPEKIRNYNVSTEDYMFLPFVKKND